MNVWLRRSIGMSWLAWGCLALALADEPGSPTPAPSKTKIQWGKFVDAGKITGEIEKVQKDGSGFKLKVTKVTPPAGRPRPGAQPNVKSEEHDFLFHDEGLVRWAKLPKKLDDQGRRTNWTPKEMQEFKLPPGAPGYGTPRTTLSPGQLVEVHYMRPKDVKPQDAVTSDYRVKYAIILSEPNTSLAKPSGEKPGEKPAPKKPAEQP